MSEHTSSEIQHEQKEIELEDKKLDLLKKKFDVYKEIARDIAFIVGIAGSAIGNIYVTFFAKAVERARERGMHLMTTEHIEMSMAPEPTPIPWVSIILLVVTIILIVYFALTKKKSKG